LLVAASASTPNGTCCKITSSYARAQLTIFMDRHLSAKTEQKSTCYCGRCITSPTDEPSHMLRISSTVRDEDGLERTSVQWPHACERLYGSQNDTNAIRQVNNVACDSLFTCSTVSLADAYDCSARHSLASATTGEGDDYQKQRRIRLDDSQ